MYSRSHTLSNSISTAAGQNSRYRQLNGDERWSTAIRLWFWCNGGIGGEVARQLRDNAGTSARCNAVRHRASSSATAWLRFAARHERDEVRAAAQGCSIIVHAVNPPGYRRWAEFVIPMLDNTIAAARIVGATIVLPGTSITSVPVPSAADRGISSAPCHPQRCHPGRNGTTAVRGQQDRHSCAHCAGRRLLRPSGEQLVLAGLVKPGKPVVAVSYPAVAMWDTSGRTFPMWRAR